MPILRRQSAVQEKVNHYKRQCKMNYAVTIEIEDPKLLKLLKVEYEKVEKDRFQVEVGRNIRVRAKDATALKAILNSIVNLFAVFEKMERIE